MRSIDKRFLFHFSPTESVSTPVNPLMVGHSAMAFRPRFRNGSDALSTPSSTPITPSSWPPRPASTGLNPTCVADHVVSFSTLNANDDPQTRCRGTCRDDLGLSRIVLLTRECEGGVSFEFWQVGPYILKRRAIYFENLCKYP